jgi:ornithine cyclodeaminase/alanine dehydrogenase-like protein (mu-crystallin family)
VKIIDANQVRSVLTLSALIDAIEVAHRRPKIEIQDSILGTEKEQYFVRHAVDGGRFMASKLITSFPANLAKGQIPAVQAVCVLFDGKDGSPLAIIDGTEITYWRTAADSALGARLLASLTPQVLLVVGAGKMSSWLIKAHRLVRPTLQHVMIWNRDLERATKVATELSNEGIVVEVATDLRVATRVADVIATCTRSHVPLIYGADLKPGAHLDLVGGYTEQTRETDDDAAKRARIFVDRKESALAGVGDILQPIKSGAIAPSDILGDLYDLVGGSVVGRRSADDITFFKNAGGAHFDLIASVVVFQELCRSTART